MIFTDVEINELIERRLVIECFEINLTHSLDTQGFSYSGPGQLYFDDDQKLRAKLYDSNKKARTSGILKLMELNSKKTEITEDDYFDFCAIDIEGNNWKADKIFLLPYIRPSSQGTVIDVPLPSIKCSQKINKNIGMAFFDILVPGKFRIPLNRYTRYLEKQVKLDKLEFSTADYSVEMRSSDSHLGIEIQRNGGDEHYKFLVAFLEGVALATGVDTYPAFYRIATDAELISFISSGDAHQPSARHAVEPVIDIRSGDEKPFIEFIACYTKERNSDHDNMIHYWRRLYHVPKPITEVAALVLTVNIEGMLKDYFSIEIVIDDELKQIIEDSTQKLKSAKFHQRISNRVANIIGDLDKPTLRQSLNRLKIEGKINKEHIDSWSRLRNKLAHAESVDDHLAQRKMIRDIHVCFDLFYRLICLCVRYQGPVVDHLETCAVTEDAVTK